jgi:hypothetical protein
MEIAVMDNSGDMIRIEMSLNSAPHLHSVSIFFENLMLAGAIRAWWTEKDIDGKELYVHA